jgi:hypothetical protein
VLRRGTCRGNRIPRNLGGGVWTLYGFRVIQIVGGHGKPDSDQRRVIREPSSSSPLNPNRLHKLVFLSSNICPPTQRVEELGIRPE